MGQYDIIIIGAGISGLSLAHYSAKCGLKTLVIEKSDRAGGCFNTQRFESGFWLELGAHTCYNSYRNLLGIIEDCGISDRLIKRENVPFKLLVGGRIKSIFSELNFLELVFSAPRILTLKKKGQSIKSYYSKITGRRNFDRVFSHVLSAVPCQKADDFPADMLFKKRPRRKDVVKKFTLTGGLQTIIDSIAKENGIELLTGIEVKEVEFKNNIFAVTTGDRRRYESRALGLATPPSVAAGLLRDSFPEVSSLLSQIKVTTVESVGVAVRKEAVSFKPVAGIIPTGDSFYSIVSRDAVPDEDYRGFTFHFKPGMDDDAKLRSICKVLGVERRQLDYVVTAKAFMPSPVLGHDRLIKKIDRLIAFKRLVLTGNYFSGLAIEDCVTRSLEEFSRLTTVLGCI